MKAFVILIMCAKLINPNLQFLWDSWNGDKTGVGQEGSSRSGKTWADIDFTVWLCSKVETRATINIIKETYRSFKTTLYDDFNRRLPMYGISSPFVDRQDVNTFKLYGNKINLMGADSESVYSGVSCDYFWMNEALDISEEVFNQSEQRCRKFWWADWNPKVTEHWVYDRICKRSDVGFIKTTFLDNPYVSAIEKKKILGYEPTHPDDREKPVKERRPHPYNIKEGTADDYMWNVYGLGLRSAPEGLVFQHVTYVDKFPPIEQVYYGMDFGYTNNATTLVKGGVIGKDLFLEKLVYEPTDSPDKVADLLDGLGLKRQLVWADSANSGFISTLQRKGFNVRPVSKPPDSIKFGVGLMKNYRINLVDCPEWRREQLGYKWRMVNGKSLNEPIDAFNDLWDASRYLVMVNLRKAA